MEINISRTVLPWNFSLINFEEYYVDFSCDIFPFSNIFHHLLPLLNEWRSLMI